MKANLFFIMLTLVFLTVALTSLWAAGEKEVPNFSETARDQVPEGYKWRVEDLYPSLEAWQTEKAAVEKLAAELLPLAPEWTATPRKMLDFEDRLTEIMKRGIRLFVYASLQSDMNLADPQFQRMKGEMQNLMVNFRSQLTFIEPDILALGQEKIDAYVLQESGLAPYKVSLDRILRGKDHILPADQEKIVALTGLFAGAPSKASTMLNDVDIPKPEITLSDGSKVTLNYANYSRCRASKIPADRRLTMASYWGNQKKYENTFSVLMDAAMKQHLFDAKVHKYGSSLEASLFDNDIDPAVYRNLISTVRENLAPLHRLLALRKRLLGLPEMKYGDIYASAVPAVEKIYPFDEARQLVQAAMAPLGPEYGATLRRAFDERWIDIYPNKGKQSGAYSSGVFGVHPYVKMNYDGGYDNVSTLAHELGHSMHSYFSNQTQHFANAQYPTFLAEIASTFNEHMLVRQMLKSETDDALKLFLLDSYLEQIRGTLFRQTLFAEFELAIHEKAEQGQTLTPDWLDKTYLDLTRAYYGHSQGVVDVEDYIQSEWSGIPHFYYNFYVFQYSTGIVASMALSDMVLKGGEAERARYLNFLKAGGSKFPLDTLREAGVDMATPAPIVTALKQFDEMVGEMEIIAGRLEAKKAAKADK